MSVKLRKHISTVIVAAITATVTAAVTGGGTATATHVGSVFYRRGPTQTVNAGSLAFLQVQCPNDAKRVVGGGFYASGNEVYLNTAWPATDSSVSDGAGDRYWAQYVGNFGESSSSVRPYAICLHGGSDRNYSNDANPARPSAPARPHWGEL